MSATGAWVVSARAFEMSLAHLKDWREAVASGLGGFRRWALVSRLIDEHTMARLAHLERRISAERLTVAFVAERGRGKSELINALFFADLGARLLPSGPGRTTLCPTEILWDPARPPGIRLLPIQTRESPQALREFIAQIETWHEVALDPAKPQTLEGACEVLSQSITVSAAQAANLGFDADPAGRIQVPRWRYAVVNLPHPLLTGGLTVLDTPGRAALDAEPELMLHRVPDSAALVFVVSVDAGATGDDKALWAEYIAPIDGLEQNCFIVLNKIDALRDGTKSEAQVLAEIDRQVRSSAEALGVAPTRVHALSAIQGFMAKVHDDRDALIKSRLYRLEQALAKGMLHQRRIDHATAVRAETRAIFAESRSLIDSRLNFTRDQLDELAALQGKNQKLVQSLAKKAGTERARLEKARAAFVTLRGAYNRHSDELAKLLSPAAARDIGLRARAALQGSRFSGSIGETLDTFFRESRAPLEKAIEVIGAVKSMMVEAKQSFAREYGVLSETSPEFGTERFLVELQRLQEHAAREFSASKLLMRGQKSIATLFFDEIALQVVHAYEIADREVRAWMGSFIRPLDTQLIAFQEQANTRIEGMGRIQDAESELLARVEELEALLKEMQSQRDQCVAYEERLGALLAVERDHSLA